ncbi:MAG TPA: extracellular solute-binding protein [Firmicutes bacterium]|nr:extracellular solute-binding protein [Bacillota bacterium]
MKNVKKWTWIIRLVILLLALTLPSSTILAKEVLRIAIMSSHGMSDSAEAIAKKFNKLYGDKIEAQVTAIGFDILLDKMLTDFTTGSGSFDVYSVGYHWIGTVGNYLYDLEEIRKKYPGVEDPNYDFKDFPPILWDTYATWKGKNIGLPFVDGTLVLFYRVDLFNKPEYKAKFKQKYGYELHMPQDGDTKFLTFKQLRDYAEFFTKGIKWRDGEQYGISLPAASGDPLLSMYAMFFGAYRRSPEGLKIFGQVDPDYGDYFTSDHRVAFDPAISDLGIKALQDYLALSKFSPNPVTRDWITSSEPFRSGLAAMFIGWGGYWPSITDPTSPVHGKVGVSVLPAPHLGGWCVAINKKTKHPKEAYIFIQMLTSKEDTKYLYEAFTETPTRLSTMTDARLKAKYPDLWVMAPSLKNPSVRPKIPVLPKLEYAMGRTLGKAWTGEMTPEVALKAVAEEWNRIVKQAGLR